MASTRESASLQIYQDPPSSAYEQIMLPSSVPGVMPLGDAASKRNVIFNPPHLADSMHFPSPIKPTQLNSSSPPRPHYGVNYHLLSVPQPKVAAFTTDSLVKKPMKSFDMHISHNTPYGMSKPLFTTFPSDPPSEKENIYSSSFSDALSEFPDQIYLQGPSNLKRLHDGSAKHDQISLPIELPHPDDLPDVSDEDTVTKPPYSYAVIIGMAILRAPNRQLTLSQIYKWISDSFAYYRVRGVSWHNSIRHNLSLNKAFVKKERPKDDPGKGSYWVIQPGYEMQFLKEKPVRKAARVSMTVAPPVRFELEEPSEPHQQQQQLPPPYVPQSRPHPPPPPPPKPPVEQPAASAREELSSDATIPASDVLEESAEQDLPREQAIQSSPPQMHSSPPVPRIVQPPQGTPPSGLFMPSSVHHSNKRRKHYSMNDSGYISSLDSSALKATSRPVSSHGDSKKRRGRAEEEIARIRQMSHDSPSKTRNNQTSYRLPSSSPLRAFGNMLPPHTPASRLAPPPRPPPSISPNSNLQAHRERVRELVGSPLREMRCLDDAPWSPSDFTIHDDSLIDFSKAGLELYDTFTNRLFDTPVGSSPLKLSSAKRPSMERAMTTGRFLAEITGGPHGNDYVDSPTKNALRLSPNANEDDVFATLDIFTNTDDNDQENDGVASILGIGMAGKDEFGGLDILKGFKKIGGEKSAASGKPRPVLGRSASNRI